MGHTRRARGARHNGGLVNPKGARPAAAAVAAPNGALAQWLRLLCQTDRYVKAPIGRFTPQNLIGRDGLDARLGLTLILFAHRTDLKHFHVETI